MAKKKKLRYTFKRKPWMFRSGLQMLVAVLRKAGILGCNAFPVILEPLTIEFYAHKAVKGKVVARVRFVAKVKVRDTLDPSEIWVRFGRRGTGIARSLNHREWFSLSPERFDVIRERKIREGTWRGGNKNVIAKRLIT